MSQRVLTVVVALLALIACKSGASIDRAAAQKVSDSFMADLVADRVKNAVNKMEPEFVQTAGQDQAEAAIRKLFDYCGRPLDSEFKHDELGFKVYANGIKSRCESSTTLPARPNIRKKVSVSLPSR